jgi:hypothetical protein
MVSDFLGRVGCGCCCRSATLLRLLMRVLPPAVASAIACPAFDASASFALFAPAATTAAIIDKIYRETVRSLAPIETRRRLDEIGMELLAIRGGLCSLLYFFSLDLAADCAHKNVKLRPRPHLRNRPNEFHDPPAARTRAHRSTYVVGHGKQATGYRLPDNSGIPLGRPARAPS